MMLTVYSKPVCKNCMAAKDWLKAKNINFTDVNVEENATAREFIMSEGHKRLPQIYFNGKVFVEGGWEGLSKMTPEQVLEEIELRAALVNENA